MSAKDPYYQTGDDELLKEICEFRDYSWQRSEKNRKQGDEDMRALSVVGPIPQAELEARQDTNNPRPHGHTDIISPYNNRVVNQARMNPRGVEVIPKGEGASKESAKLREDRLRGIDYESKASQADLTALQNAVDRGIGYERVDVEFASPRSRNLQIVVKRIVNPNSILDDPDCEKADRSDRKKLLIGQWIPVADARQRWKGLKDATPANWSAEMLTQSTAWSRSGQMLFAEYWKVNEKRERLLFFGGAIEGVFISELEDKGLRLEKLDDAEYVVDSNGQPFLIEDDREGVITNVIQYFTNGLQIFERKPWFGSWIPFPCCVGREKYEGDELVIESMTRKLRQPNLNFDACTWGVLEQFGLSTKVKILASDKAVIGYEDMYKNANRNPQALLKWHERDEQGNQNTKPEGIEWTPRIEPYEMARNSFIRDAQNAAGMVGVDQKQRQNESGVAQDKIDEASDISSFHFIDSWLQMIEFRGRIENELLDKIEDSKRTVGFRTKEGKYKPSEIAPMEMGDGSVQHPYGPATSHDVTISTGPSYQSQMQKSREFLGDTASKPEFLANPMSPLIIEAMNVGPLTDKMKQVAVAVQPPNVQAIYAQDDDEGQEPLPPEAVQKIQQKNNELTAMNQHAKELEKKVIELEDDIKAKKIESESKEHIADQDNQTKIEIERMKEAHEIELKRLELELKHIEMAHKAAMGPAPPNADADPNGDAEDHKAVVKSLIAGHKDELEKLKSESGVEQVRSEFERSRSESQQTKDDLLVSLEAMKRESANEIRALESKIEAMKEPAAGKGVRKVERDSEGRIARIVDESGTMRTSRKVEHDSEGRIARIVDE